MNIFKHRDSFFSCLDSRVTEDSLLSLFRLAKQIRLRLGKQGYLLDCYLSLLLEGLCGNLAYDAADEGFQSAGKLQSLLFHVLGGTELIKPHLNGKILKRFLIAPMAAVFAQGFTDDLLCRLTSRDYETSKQMFQLLLDSLPNIP